MNGLNRKRQSLIDCAITEAQRILWQQRTHSDAVELQ
jgi:hypothetical protein